MSNTLHRLAAFGISAAMQGYLICVALAQGTPPSSTSGFAPQYGAAEAVQRVEPAAPSETTPSTELPVLFVTSVEILRTAIEPKLDIVRVTGLTGSAGWSEPQLVPTYAGKPFDDILDLQFIATMPEESQKAEGFVPIGAIFPLEQGHPFKGVRVRASENAIEVKTRRQSASTGAKIASGRNLSKRAGRSRASRASFAKRIFQVCYDGLPHHAASEASRRIQIGSI